MEEVTSNMTIAVMMMYLACHEVEWKCTNIKSYPIFCDSGFCRYCCSMTARTKLRRDPNHILNVFHMHLTKERR